MNGLYDSLCIIIVFPLIVYLGASGELRGKFATRICKFLGDISYPMYIVHYPLIYIFTAWAVNKNVPIQNAWPAGLLVLISSIAIAYASLKLYDIPVRKWLTNRFMTKSAK
jgi:peptidoglycan/LPS O-acetylase OafA/YrhL